MASNRRGYQAAVLKAFRAKDFTLRVVERTEVTDHVVVLRFDGGGLFEVLEPYPTVWLRLWFDRDGSPHQRAFTIIDPDVAADRFSLLFALHDGTAADWARDARPGDEIESTLLSSKFAVPDPLPREFLLVGDMASLPAINTILDEVPETAARVWLEYAHDGDPSVPVHASDAHRVEWVRRERDGGALVETVDKALAGTDPDGAFAWVACDMRTTRAVVKLLKGAGLGRDRVKHQAYWR